MEAIKCPGLIAGGFLRVGCQPVAFDAFDCQARDVLERNMQYGVLGNGGVAVAHHPFFVELCGRRGGQFRGDFVKTVR